MKTLISIITILLFANPVNAEDVKLPAGTYILDKTHASITFTVSHLGFSNYTMSFDDFDATLELDPENLETSSITASVQPLSIDLPNPPEGFTDEIANGEQWLNAQKFPSINFASQKVELTGDKTANVIGELEILGIKKPLTLQVTFNGGYLGHPRDPKARAGFSAKGSFKRSDYGMTYGIPEDGSTMGVGDNIDIAIEAELSGPALEEKSE